MKKVIILSGVSGTGKTSARTHDPDLKNLPCVDIADIYRKFPEFDWMDATACLIRKASMLFREHGIVVIEGYFLKGSFTRNWLVRDLKVAGVHNVDIREFWAPIDTCVDRVAAQYAAGETSAAETRRRIELIRKCWKPQSKKGLEDAPTGNS